MELAFWMNGFLLELKLSQWNSMKLNFVDKLINGSELLNGPIEELLNWISCEYFINLASSYHGNIILGGMSTQIFLL